MGPLFTPAKETPSVARLRQQQEDGASKRARCESKSLRVTVIPILILILVFPLLLTAQNSAPSEYQVKAAFLYNFAKFVDFPDGTFPTPQSVFTICILGQDPFGNFLDSTVSGKMVGEHPVNIERIRRTDEAGECRIIFVSASEGPRVSEVLVNLRQHSILTVADMPGFASAGGSIEFVLEENHVRFAINPGAAMRSRLKISSKLLALARIVHEPGPAGKD